MKKFFVIIIPVSFLFILNCKKDKAEEIVIAEESQLTAADCDTSLSYISDIKPILTNSCATAFCHDAASARGGINLTSHSSTSSVSNSLMLGAIKHEAGFEAMPRNASKLSADQIKNIECWILLGKKNN